MIIIAHNVIKNNHLMKVSIALIDRYKSFCERIWMFFHDRAVAQLGSDPKGTVSNQSFSIVCELTLYLAFSRSLALPSKRYSIRIMPWKSEASLEYARTMERTLAAARVTKVCCRLRWKRDRLSAPKGRGHISPGQSPCELCEHGRRPGWGFRWFHSPERARQLAGRCVPPFQGSMPRGWISAPGRRCAAHAAALCPGLICGCPFGATEQHGRSVPDTNPCGTTGHQSGGTVSNQSFSRAKLA